MIFERPGPSNSLRTIELAVAAAKEKGISHIVVASYSGETARLVTEQTDLNIICVSGAFGAEEPGKHTMSQEMRQTLERSGVSVLVTSHILSGVERGLSTKFGGIYPAEIISHTLRMFGQGTKVCAEVAIMALDAGLIPHSEPVIVLGGTGSGVDTAVIMTPAHAKDVLKTRIHEILCKPY